jgi:CO/xanthine dehydrogenase Mo-binding subunit
MKKIYIHSGKGYWLGSKVIVVASSKEEAETLISEVLISIGLNKEPLNIEEISIKNNSVIYADNGDY